MITGWVKTPGFLFIPDTELPCKCGKIYENIQNILKSFHFKLVSLLIYFAKELPD